MQSIVRSRLAAALGRCHTLFMKNHGLLVTGSTMAQAYKRLYNLERACRMQILALGTGKPLALLPESMVDAVRTPNPRDSHDRAERERLYFEAMMRVVDRDLPGYRE